LKAVKTYTIKFITLVLALQILNLSICGGDEDKYSITTYNNNIGESNQIDCLAEYVSEIVLRQLNAFPENGAHNSNSNHSLLLKHIPLKVFPNNFSISIAKPVSISIIPIPLTEEYKYLFLKEVIPQPPRQA
jgi:hypothetical protein